MNNATIGNVNDIKGFFQKYFETIPTHFINLFGETTESDRETLDFCLSDLYGARYLQEKFNKMFSENNADFVMNRIVKISDKMFFENWINTKESIEKAFLTDVSKPLLSVKTTESEKTGNNTTENKVNAFDSETASDSDNSTHDYTDNAETTETTHYSNGKTATENAQNQIDFTRNNDFLEIIINDVLSVCCVSVYDSDYVCSRSSGSSGSSNLEQLENRVTNIENLIPSNASTSNKLATMKDIQNGYDDTEIKHDIEDINSKIPSNASTSNKLATMEDIPDTTGFATESQLNAITDLIPSNASTSNKLATMEDIPDTTGFATESQLNAITDLIPSNASTSNKLATMNDIISGSGVGITKKTLRYTSIHSFQWSATTDQLRGFDTTEDFSDNSIYFAYVSSKSFTSSQITIASIFKSQSDSTNNKLVTDKLGVQFHNTGASIAINVGDWIEVTLLKVS